MKCVFVSGCYDILHAGHVQFFTEARALGDHLTVSFASDEVLWKHKQRRSSLPQDHKKALIESLRMVDAVVIGEDHDLGLDFKSHFLELRPNLLVVTEDDQYADAKKALCPQVGATYMVLPKTPPRFEPVSTSSIVRYIRAPREAPLRVDFAGGWLDVPRFARADGYIVNCAISPKVSLRNWPYERNAGLGGSGAWALLNGFDGVSSELDLGVGWQDPAIIREGGLCVWRSGEKPRLDIKTDGSLVAGRMALYYTGKPHDTPGLCDLKGRDFDGIAESGRLAREGVWKQDLQLLAKGILRYHETQLHEGMEPLSPPVNAIAWKYCGGGHGGYAVFLFPTAEERQSALDANPDLIAIEPS
jgi:cytidyltransferase-like protein